MMNDFLKDTLSNLFTEEPHTKKVQQPEKVLDNKAALFAVMADGPVMIGGVNTFWVTIEDRTVLLIQAPNQNIHVCILFKPTTSMKQALNTPSDLCFDILSDDNTSVMPSPDKCVTMATYFLKKDEEGLNNLCKTKPSEQLVFQAFVCGGLN